MREWLRRSAQLEAWLSPGLRDREERSLHPGYWVPSRPWRKQSEFEVVRVMHTAPRKRLRNGFVPVDPAVLALVVPKGTTLDFKTGHYCRSAFR